MVDLLTFGSLYVAGYIFAETQNVMLFMLGWVMFLVFRKYALDKRLLVASLGMAAFAFAFVFGNDPALVATWRSGAVLPYGVLWRVFNPFWWTDFYQYVCAGWVAVEVLLMWRLGVRRKVFGWGWVVFAELYGLVSIQSQNGQGIFPMMFVFLSPVFLPLVAGWAVAKLPIGFPLSSHEWQCTFGGYTSILYVQTPRLDYYVPLCSRLSYSVVEYPSLIFGLTLYALQAAVMLYVLWRWWPPLGASVRWLFK